MRFSPGLVIGVNVLNRMPKRFKIAERPTNATRTQQCVKRHEASGSKP
jgi:hypothetical protein